MKDAASIRKRLDEVKTMDTQAALSALADIQYEIGMSACMERKELRSEVEAIRVIVSGNGHPEHSLIARLKNVEDCTEQIHKDISEIKLALIGDMKGHDGLLGRIKTVEKARDDMTKIMWIIVSVSITQIVATILGLL